MTRFITILAALVFVLAFSGIAQADVVSYSVPQGATPKVFEQINFPGFDAYLSAANQEEWLHSWTDDNGKTYSHIHPKETYGGVNFVAEQGLGGKYIYPLMSSSEIRRYDANGNFNVQVEFRFIFVDEETDWTTPPAGGMNWNLLGMKFNLHSSITHDYDGYYDYEEDEWIETYTNDVRGDFWFNFENAETKYGWLNVQPYSYWMNEFEYEGMTIEANFDLTWMGSPETLGIINSSFQVIPEPATMALLGMGFVPVALRRRRRASSSQ